MDLLCGKSFPRAIHNPEVTKLPVSGHLTRLYIPVFTSYQVLYFISLLVTYYCNIYLTEAGVMH